MAELLLIALGLPVGILIGAVGIGGVLLAPALIHLMGLNSHDAIALSLASFIPAGATALAVNGVQKTALSRPDCGLLAAIVPGAALGAVAMHGFSSQLLSLLISVFVAITGIWNLTRRPQDGQDGASPRNALMLGIGFFAGAVSAISGTGGPLVLIPLLLWFGLAINHALAVALVAQLPIATAATTANTAIAGIDVKTAVILGASVVCGMLIGMKASHRIDPNNLARAVSWCLLGAGIVLSLIDVAHLFSAAR